MPFWSFEMSVTAFNTMLLLASAAVPIGFLIATRKADWGDARAHETSMRARLPFCTDAVHRGVRVRLRTITRVNMWALLGAILLMGGLFLWTPLVSSSYAMWILTLVIVVAVVTTGSVVAQVRERLFSPTPAAPRIARATVMRTRDYLGAWRRLTPVVLLGSGTAATAALLASAPGRTDGGHIVATAAALVLAFAVTGATRVAEHRILDQPQPASDTLELARDDLFRADALGSLRMSAAMTSWLPLGMAATLLLSAWLPRPETLMGLFPWWGIPLLLVLYSLGSGKLPAALHPLSARATPVGSPS